MRSLGDFRGEDRVLQGFPENVSNEVAERLDTLVCVADILGIDDVSFASYSTAIMRLSDQRLEAKQSLNCVAFIEQELRGHLATAQHEERLITKWTESFEAERTSGESTEALQRRREGLLKKAKEYKKELDILKSQMPDEPPITVTQLLSQQEAVRKTEQAIKAKRAKVKVFQGLPPNIEQARNELRRARDEQMKLIQLRERLLDNMAKGVA